MSILFCDTNCELWWTKAEELGLKVIRMPYTIDNTEYFYDLGRETDFDWFYGKVRDRHMPITSALNSNDYHEYFEPYFKAGEDILYISFSSEMSGTFNYMDTAVKELSKQYPQARFRRFDTKSISMGAGMQVYLAAKLFKSGASTDEVYAYLEKITKNVCVCFAVDDLNHLKRGGRLSGAAAVIGTLFNIKPVIKIGDDGKLFVDHKESGRKKAIKYIYDLICENVKEIDKYPIVIEHADCKDDCDLLYSKIKEKFPTADIWVQPIGPVIGTHCGPGTIGAIFMSNKRA